MGKWLVKSEPSVWSIDMMKRHRVTHWDGVRNYQARNFLRAMKKGDEVLFYHSNEEPVGVAGIVKVKKEAYPDPSQFDSKSEYYDEKSTKEAPRWFCPDFEFVDALPRVVTLAELKKVPALKSMTLLQKGSRLSVHQVTEAQFKTVVELSRKKA